MSGAAPASSRASSLPRRLVCNAERGAWTRWRSWGYLSFRTLQRGNAFGNALRHMALMAIRHARE
ncbi:hypothetical protein DND58_25245 [Pseudomonas syringae pv. pisi]|nr:hypothetical protein DND62_25115 [Pseudomonas syringae pv. pisi]PYD25632.1 hypothetical protein DND58_25245 [Pseudomonas syringae pv. pisi]PYD26694.1 hypothetical protein DND67_25000 [Pseudomonas syringae pv. pisi]